MERVEKALLANLREVDFTDQNMQELQRLQGQCCVLDTLLAKDFFQQLIEVEEKDDKENSTDSVRI